MNTAKETVSIIEKIVRSVLNSYNIPQQIYHYGTIQRVNGDGTVNLYIDGSPDLKRNIRCNPDIPIKETDKVIVIYINGDAKNAFVFCRRSK